MLLFCVPIAQNPQTQSTMSNPSKKPRLEHLFRCRNSHCPKPGGFTTEKGLRIHYGKSPHCGAHAAACQAYIRRNNIIRPHPSPNQPWDFGILATMMKLVLLVVPTLGFFLLSTMIQ